MGYQALLFCPDEKTARTVTQVLSELDFTVVPCTEPFAAVKKLMAEHFDAVVVDCDNEQNATLLFKSARNTVNNQSSLAVAVVEGQAGVAKAFRIGANLVLTKPINVEQAKGTLRVARGLLRKNETAKPGTTAASASPKPAPTAPAPPKPAPLAPITAAPTPRASVPAAFPSTPIQPPQPMIAASASKETESDDDVFEAIVEDVAPAAKPESPTSAPMIFAAASTQPTTKTATSSTHSQGPAPASTFKASPATSAGFGAGSASAPAPAREPKPSVSTEATPSRVIAPTESAAKDAAIENSSAGEPAAAATAFTFGGNAATTAPAPRGSKNALLAVAAVVLVAAIGYAVWMQWVRSSGAETGPVHVAIQPAKIPAASPQPAPSGAPAAATSPASGVASSVPAATSDSTITLRTAVAPKASSVNETTTSGPVHPSKAADAPDSSRVPSSSAAANRTPATNPVEQPIVIKHERSPSSARPDSTGDAQAPSLGAVASANTVALPNLGGVTKAPTPVLQTLHVSQGVSRGLLVKQVQPVYPPMALRLRTEGSVELLATISKDGDISAVKVLSGDPQLAHSAADAVKKWKYKAYLLNGEPVEIQTPVTVNFKLPR